MANWQYKLYLKDLWKAKDEDKLTIQELAEQVAKRIRKSSFYQKYEKELRHIAGNFECCEEDVEEFDSILDDLYDWADTPLQTSYGEMQRRMCWVKTI